MAQPWIATKPIDINGHRAHNPGDIVPDENVKLHGWEDSVARAGSNAAEEAAEPETPAKPGK